MPPKRHAKPAAMPTKLTWLGMLFVVACSGSPSERPSIPDAPAPLPAQPPPEPAIAGKAPKAPVPLEEYFNVRRIRGASFSHDDKLVAYGWDGGGRIDIWVQAVEGGAPRQVTRVPGFVHGFAFSPTADVLLYESDNGGDELPHIFLTDSNGSAPSDIVADYPPGKRTNFVRWADDGRTFLFLSNLRDDRYLDLYEYTLATKKAERLWQSDDNVSFSLTSRDHRAFIVRENISDTDSNLYLVERGKKDKVLLTPHTGEVLHRAATFSRDRRTLYFLSDEGREFTSLRALDLKTKKAEPLLEAEWDVEGADFSKTWKYFLTTTNVDGLPQVALGDAKSKAGVKLPDPPGGGVFEPLTFSWRDRYIAAVHVTDSTPGGIYIIDLEKNEAKKIVDPLPASLASRTMTQAESVRVPSFDGRKVPAFVYRPKGTGPFPAVIDVHGGPTAQSRIRFDPLRQYLLSKGYVVMVPNVRGSTGYGKSYTKLDNMDLGGGPLKDVVHCKKWLTANAKVDPQKVVVLGGSYGGYMALAAATFTPGEFAAHVDYFGVSDLKSLVESFPPYWAAFSTFIYNKFGDPKNPAHAKYQRERSPLHFVDRIKRPLLVVQGENDARVKKDQSDRIVAALNKRKIPVHYLVIPGEGHGFSKNENRLAAYRATDRFLDHYLFRDSSQPILDQ